MALCAGCDTLRTIGGTADQQLADRCGARDTGRYARVSGGAAVLMMQAANVREGDDRSLVQGLYRTRFRALLV